MMRWYCRANVTIIDMGGELSKREGCFSNGGRSVQSEMMNYICLTQI